MYVWVTGNDRLPILKGCDCGNKKVHGSHGYPGLCTSWTFYKDVDYNRLCVPAMPPLHGGKFECILEAVF